MKTILYYVTSHGYGHGVRAQLVATELANRFGFCVVLRTMAPPFLFSEPANGEIIIESADVDAGPVQPDSMTTDTGATLIRFTRLVDQIETAARKEQSVVDKWNPSVIVSDIAPLGVATAKRACLPSVVVANFLWDWITEEYQAKHVEFKSIARKLTEIYSGADMIIRTPLNGGMGRYGDKITDIGLITRRSLYSQEEARQRLGLGVDEKYALVSLGGIGIDQFLKTIAHRVSKVRLLILGDRDDASGPIHIFDRKKVSHPDLVMAADLVIGKLGYGLCSEIIAARRPILYTSRDDFVEYRVLHKEIRKYVACKEAPANEFFHQRLDASVEALMNRDASEGRLDINGAEVAARYINEMVR